MSSVTRPFVPRNWSSSQSSLSSVNDPESNLMWAKVDRSSGVASEYIAAKWRWLAQLSRIMGFEVAVDFRWCYETPLDPVTAGCCLSIVKRSILRTILRIALSQAKNDFLSKSVNSLRISASLNSRSSSLAFKSDKILVACAKDCWAVLFGITLANLWNVVKARLVSSLRHRAMRKSSEKNYWT